MDTHLKNILLEMRRLMDYDRSLGQFINEQGSADIYIDRLAKEKASGKPRPADKLGLTYRQKFITHDKKTNKKFKGYFDNDMKLGECFDVVFFDEQNTNALSAMDIPQNQIFKDQYGYYTKGESLSYGGETRIYLPKDEFFKGLKDIVKSFTAYQTCNDQKKKQNGRKYTLIYQLVEPEKAVAIFTTDADGDKETSTDPSRGWQITNFAGSQSGYFAESTAFENESNLKTDKAENVMLPVYYDEYSLQNYGEEYGRSEFDIWYDSGWGIVTIIAAQILLAIATAGIGNAISASIGATGLASTMIVVGAELSVEFTIGLIEAKYLFDRGYNTGAYMVLIFSLFPVFNRLGLIKRLAGGYSETKIIKMLQDIGKLSKNEKFKTPGDVKSWLKTLDDKTRLFVQDVLEQGGKALEELNQAELKKDINKGLAKIMDEIKTSSVTKPTRELASEILKDSPKRYGETFKMIGINLVAVLGSLPAFFTLVKDDEDFKRDPQGFFKNGESKIEQFKKVLDEKKMRLVIQKNEELQNKIIQNPNDPTPQIELLNFFKDLGDFGKKDYESYRTNLYKEMYNLTKSQMLEEYKYKRELMNLEEYKILIPGEEILLNACPSIPKAPYNNKQQVCDFLTWVSQNKKDFTFQLPELTGNHIFNGVETCDELDESFSDNYIINQCQFKIAYQKYGKEYETQLNK
jgi:hypothetical protein